jgi:hypothetical protein
MKLEYQQWSYVTNEPYSIRKFVAGIKEMSYAEILDEIEREIKGVFAGSHGVKGAIAERARGSEDYILALQRFQDFISYNRFRGEFSKYEGRLFFSVLKTLVERAELPPERLEIERQIETLQP